MKRTILAASIAFGSLFGAATLLNAASGHVNANCDLTIDRDAMSYTDAHEIYLCIADKQGIGYQTGDKRWVNIDHVKQFRSWTPASTLPADPGVHSGRFLFTYVNSIGASEYLKFKDEGAKMPVGTVIAKESFSVKDSGKTKLGPLFIMEKVAPGTSPKTNDWYYTAVQPNGVPMAVNVFKACNECHSGFEGSDYLGYPDEEVRVGVN